MPLLHPRTDKIVKVGRDPSFNYRNARYVLAIHGVSTCLTSAMGLGGGFVPMILTYD